MVQYSKQVKSTSIALLIFSLLTISIDAILLATQIINDLLPTFGIGIFLGFFGILAGSYGICAAKATKAEFFFGKYNTSGCWSVFGAIFTFFGLFWLSFAFSCHAVCILEYGEPKPSNFYQILNGQMPAFDDDDSVAFNTSWIVNGTCLNFQKDWTAEASDPNIEIDNDDGNKTEETGTVAYFVGTEDPGTDDQMNFTTIGIDDNTTFTTTIFTTDDFGLTTVYDNSTDKNEDPKKPKEFMDLFENSIYVKSYMGLYLSELVLIFILFIVFIVLANSTGCCFCGSGVVDIEDEEKGDQDSNASESSDEEDSSSGSDSSDDSSDED